MPTLTFWEDLKTIKKEFVNLLKNLRIFFKSYITHYASMTNKLYNLKNISAIS